MNTNPDDAKLALWLDDELEGAELASFEAWALTQPQHVAAREETRRWRAMMSDSVPKSEEPPYPDFFNSRISQAIREQSPQTAVIGEIRPAFWKSWFLPISACAGMALTFWLGTKAKEHHEIVVEGAPRAIPVDQIVYTPETGVKADVFGNGGASATVIVLNGVKAIPDDLDFAETTSISTESEAYSTADADAADKNPIVAP